MECDGRSYEIQPGAGSRDKPRGRETDGRYSAKQAVSKSFLISSFFPPAASHPSLMCSSRRCDPVKESFRVAALIQNGIKHVLSFSVSLPHSSPGFISFSVSSPPLLFSVFLTLLRLSGFLFPNNSGPG